MPAPAGASPPCWGVAISRWKTKSLIGTSFAICIEAPDASRRRLLANLPRKRQNVQARRRRRFRTRRAGRSQRSRAMSNRAGQCRRRNRADAAGRAKHAAQPSRQRQKTNNARQKSPSFLKAPRAGFAKCFSIGNAQMQPKGPAAAPLRKQWPPAPAKRAAFCAAFCADSCPTFCAASCAGFCPAGRAAFGAAAGIIRQFYFDCK